MSEKKVEPVLGFRGTSVCRLSTSHHSSGVRGERKAGRGAGVGVWRLWSVVGMGLWECVAGLGAAGLAGLWSAGLSVVLVVVGLREVCLVGDLVHWANLLLGWPCPALGLPALLVLDFLAALATTFLLGTCYYFVLKPVLKRLGLRSFKRWFKRWLIHHFAEWCICKPRQWVHASIFVAGLVRICWVRDPEAVERLEDLAAGLRPVPSPPLDPATDNSVCAALHALHRIAAANKIFVYWLVESWDLPRLANLAAALRPGNWDEARPRLGVVLSGLRATVLQRPSPASPRLRALLLRLSADLCSDHAHQWAPQSPEAYRLTQTALHVACDQDEDSGMAAAAWEVVLKLSWPWDRFRYGLEVLCQDPQRPMPWMGKIFEWNDQPAAQWFVRPEGEPRAPLAGLATQARLGLRWAGLELSRVLGILPGQSQERREAFRDVGGFGSLAPPLLHALRHGVPALNQGFVAHYLNELLLAIGYGVHDVDTFDERFVSHCLRLLLAFLRNSGTGQVERALAVGELVGAGLVPLLRGLAAAETRPELASAARDLLPLLAVPHRLHSSLGPSNAQAQEDAYIARRLPHRLLRTL